MKVVILAAGRGTRMGELTNEVPKPLLEVHGKTLLEHKFDMLPEAVAEIVLVVGYHGPKVKERLGDAYNGRPITYVMQEVLDGTGGALWSAQEHLTERFLVMMGDDLYTREDAERCLAMNDWVMLVGEQASGAGGRIVMEDGAIVAIEEGKCSGPVLTSTNLFVLDQRLFNYPLIPKSPGSVEYGLPQTILHASRIGKVPFTAVTARKWIQVTSPEDLKSAEEKLGI